jgi:uncharacterized protein (DUF433 family)
MQNLVAARSPQGVARQSYLAVLLIKKVQLSHQLLKLWRLRFSFQRGSVLAMSLVIEQTQPVPLAADRDGIIRVSGTRVTLETVATAFEQGATAEEIVQQYPSLPLADVYAVLGYLLRRQIEVAAYLELRSERCSAVRLKNERQFDPKGVRARLLARRSPSATHC